MLMFMFTREREREGERELPSNSQKSFESEGKFFLAPFQDFVSTETLYLGLLEQHLFSGNDETDQPALRRACGNSKKLSLKNKQISLTHSIGAEKCEQSRSGNAHNVEV